MIYTFTLAFLKSPLRFNQVAERTVIKQNDSLSSRHYSLDWLRVLAFSFLILMHTGEIFTEKSFWIKNGDRLPYLGEVLFFYKQWRMPLLFIISGTAISIMFRKMTLIAFIKNRISQILVPLFGAMLFVIPPQIYYFEKFKGSQESFLNFYLRVADLEWFPKGNLHWLHLWYLAFVFVFSICVMPSLQLAATERGKFILKYLSTKLSQPLYLFSFAFIASIPYYLVQFSKGGDLAELLYFLPYFLFGAFFLTNSQIMEALAFNVEKVFIAGCITATGLYALMGLTSWFSLLSLNELKWFKFIGVILKTGNQWLWLQVVIGLALRYLNFNSPTLQYLNKLVYPLYILHQTVIVITAYYIVQIPGSIIFKFTAILSSSLMIMFLLYEFLLKRTVLTRTLFGIKHAPTPNLAIGTETKLATQ